MTGNILTEEDRKLEIEKMRSRIDEYEWLLTALDSASIGTWQMDLEEPEDHY